MALAEVILIGLSLLPNGIASSSTDEIRNRADEAFHAGVELRGEPERSRPEFRRAAELYEELVARVIQDPSLFRSQGNAYLLSGEVPRAILAYRRGLRVAPWDSELQQDLAYARGLVHHAAGSLARQPSGERPPWLPKMSWDLQFGLLCLLQVVTCVAATRWLITRHILPRDLALAGLFVEILLVMNFACDLWQYRQECRHSVLVIAEDGLLLRKGNGISYPARSDSPVNRGTEALLLFERGDWIQIELAGGEIGWVPRQSVLIDESRSGD